MTEYIKGYVAGACSAKIQALGNKTGSAGYVRHAMRLEAGYVAEIESLKAWIRHVGASADICTRQVLGDVCENCRCKHGKKVKNVRFVPLR